MKILVSACLLGIDCKYNGGNNLNAKVIALGDGNELIPVCPECLGGLPTPRIPSEIVGGTVINAEGTNVDAEFRHGAQLALDIARREHIDLAVLQSRSPSCGVRQIYDGSFTGVLKPGSGIFASLLKENGFKILDAEELTSPGATSRQ